MYWHSVVTSTNHNLTFLMQRQTQSGEVIRWSRCKRLAQLLISYCLDLIVIVLCSVTVTFPAFDYFNCFNHCCPPARASHCDSCGACSYFNCLNHCSFHALTWIGIMIFDHESWLVIMKL